MSAVDVADIYNNIWALTDTQNQNLTPDEQKTQFLYRHMKEEVFKLEENIVRKKDDVKNTWTEVYQLIGFFSVFQGVWFQCIAQLAAQRNCRFYIIPIVLSVLVSGATLVGVFVKFADWRFLQKCIHIDRLESEVLNSRIGGFTRYGLKFNLKKSDERSKVSVAALKTLFDAELVESYQTTVIVLAGLAIFSGLFAWLIYAVMCDEFP